MLVKELRSKNHKELIKLIDDLKAELFMLRFKNSTGQLEEFHKISIVKKDIAKVFTIINEMKNNQSIVKKETPKIKELPKLEKAEQISQVNIEAKNQKGAKK